MSRARPLDLFGCPLSGTSLIEASAGTGKTWNICGLYVRLLLERALPVQRILVVTFTKAATAELRERIRARIVETLALLRGAPAGPDPFVPALLRALRDRGLQDTSIDAQLDLARATFDEAAIFTIHGFCQRALADVPFAAQMPLALELLENDAALRREAVNDFWRRRIVGDERAAWLLGRNDTPEAMDRLLQRRLAKPLSLLRWPEDVDRPPVLELAALREAYRAARDAWPTARERVLHVLQRALPQLSATSYKPQALLDAAAEWDALLFPAEPAHLPGTRLQKAALLGTRKLEDCTKKGCTTPRDPYFSIAQALLDAADALRAGAAAQRLALLKALLDEGPQRVRQLKRERRVVAFDDLLYNLHERLADDATPWLADALRERYPAALIDEFQDTDPLQFAIFRRIYARGDAPLFFVGDPKQAIYSFRNADLHTYLLARQHVDAEHTLAHNQRSSPALIGALNTLFSTNPRAFMLPGLDHHPVQVGDRPRSAFVDHTGPRGGLQVWTLPNDGGTGLRKDDALAAASRACAAEIARLLRAATDGAVMLDGRPLAASDIAVLVRTHRQGNLMRDALQALRIGSVELSQASVFHTSDAEELERVLAAVLEPSREPLLRAALVTEMLGHDAADLEALADDEPRAAALMTRFASYRDEWRRAGIAPTLRRLMRDEGVSERLLARPDGERRMTNLLHLAERLQDASAEHRSPPALLRWLRAERRQLHGSEAAQLRLDSDRNLVQIVTIHKSKGLEYPVVFCPYLWDAAAMPDRDDGIEYHDDDHRPVIDFRPDAKQDAAVKRRIAIERGAEELRLVYVALTRAVHRCHVVAGFHGDRPHLAAISARGMLNWLVAGNGMTPDEWFGAKLDPHAVITAWSGLAASSGGTVHSGPLPDRTGVPIDTARPSAVQIRALDPPRTIPDGWRLGSFSGMLQAGAPAAAAERDAADHDAVDHDADAAAPLVIEPVPADDILAFPRGMDAGTCLHAMLERADFRNADSWLPAVRAALAMHPQSLPGADARGRLERMALAMLRDVASAPLPTGFALSDVNPARRLEELEFHLPALGLTPAALARALHRHGYDVPPLAFGRLDGWLNGFIDLVFEHGGRHYLVDWKSNHLGTSMASYAPAALQAAMAEHGYHLQALLYAVALDRHLALRQPGYDRARHFGGVLYLFVRGMRPGWQADGQPAGVHFHRPRDETLDALSALLGRSKAGVAA